MKKFTVQAILLIAVIGFAIFFFNTKGQIPNLPFLPQQPVFKELQIDDTKIKVEVADTQAKRSKGLGGKQSLASDEGMLFVFPKADKYPFWMKGLAFPLDFVWIRGEVVVDILQDVQPPSPGQTDDSLPIYLPREEVDKVLEINAGTIQRLDIKVGDAIKL